MDLKEADILGPDIGHHWYYRTKAKAMMRMLAGIQASTILDVGAGSGFFSRHLLAETGATAALCVDTGYEREWDALVSGKPVQFRRSTEQVDADLVLLMDVLEHVDHDVALLGEYASKIPRGTHFLISVPAFEFLWSGHDVFLEHKRRYRLRQLETLAESAGLTVLRGAYYFGAVFPIATALRLLDRWRHGKALLPRSQLTRHHPVVNALLSALSTAELPLMKHNRIAGLTAFCLAQRP